MERILDGIDGDISESKATRVTSLHASLGSLGQGSTTASAGKNRTAPKKKVAKGKEDDEKSAGVVGGVQGTEASAFLLKLQKEDPEMASVCEKHMAIRGITASCLGFLSVAHFLKGMKWGQKLNGAGRCQTIFGIRKLQLLDSVGHCSGLRCIRLPYQALSFVKYWLCSRTRNKKRSNKYLTLPHCTVLYCHCS